MIAGLIDTALGVAVMEALPRFFEALTPKLEEQYEFPGLTVKSWWDTKNKVLHVKVTCVRHGAVREVCHQVCGTVELSPEDVISSMLFDVCQAIAHSRFRRRP